MKRGDKIEDFLTNPLPPSTRAWLTRHRRQQKRLACYAVSTGWSEAGAAWLSELGFHEALDRMAVAERRSPDEVMESLLRFRPTPKRPRKEK